MKKLVPNRERTTYQCPLGDMKPKLVEGLKKGRQGLLSGRGGETSPWTSWGSLFLKLPEEGLLERELGQDNLGNVCEGHRPWRNPVSEQRSSH